ncbi:MAG: 16S rRNA (cytosine(967)-C(5))-methyltransferase RsmB [bacterium]
MIAAKPQKASARLVAVKLLAKAETSDRFIDHLLETSPAVKNLAERDRALLLQIVNGVLKNRTYLDLVVEHYIRKGYNRFPVIFKNILRTAFYQLIFLQRIPAYAVVSEAVRHAKKLLDTPRAKLVNAVLRNFLRNPFTPDTPDASNISALAAYYSHPRWLVERYVSQFGRQDVDRWLQANNETPPVYVRSLTSRELDSDKIERFGKVENYFKLAHGCRLENIEGWREGRFIVQDPAAGLVVELAAAQPGERVIDLCAAPGGKTIALAHMIGPKGHLDAVEISDLRAQKLRENIARTGQKNITITIDDARSVRLPPADLVLVDAPCSGLGVLSRRADLRWKRKPEDFGKLIVLQKELLSHAAQLVAPGGRLIYSTCSIDRQENEEIAHYFLQKFSDFSIENAASFVSADYSTSGGFLKILPHVHSMDGTYGVRFKRLK